MDTDILVKAIDQFGNQNQISKAIEEMSELISELARYQNNKGMNVNLIEEIADVSIMVDQLKLIFGSELVDCQRAVKLRRLKGILDDLNLK